MRPWPCCSAGWARRRRSARRGRGRCCSVGLGRRRGLRCGRGGLLGGLGWRRRLLRGGSAGAAVCGAAVAVCSAGWAGAGVCGCGRRRPSAGWAGTAVCGAGRRRGLRLAARRRRGEFGRGLARLAGLCLRSGRRGCGARRNRFGLGDHRRLGRGGLGRLRSRFAARRGRWLRCRGRWLRCRGCRLRCGGRRRIWGLGRRHGGLGHTLWRGVALLRGRRLGDQIAVQLPPLAILAGGQANTHSVARGSRTMNCQSQTLAMAFAGRPSADQRGLHRIGARARQPMRVQSVIPGDLVRSRHDRSPGRSKNSRCRRHGSSWPDTPPARRGRAQPGRMQNGRRELIRWRSARPSAPGASVAAGPCAAAVCAANPGPEPKGHRRRSATLEPVSGSRSCGVASWLQRPPSDHRSAHLKAIPSATISRRRVKYRLTHGAASRSKRRGPRRRGPRSPIAPAPRRPI